MTSVCSNFFSFVLLSIFSTITIEKYDNITYWWAVWIRDQRKYNQNMCFTIIKKTKMHNGKTIEHASSRQM